MRIISDIHDFIRFRPQRSNFLTQNAYLSFPKIHLDIMKCALITLLWEARLRGTFTQQDACGTFVRSNHFLLSIGSTSLAQGEGRLYSAFSSNRILMMTSGIYTRAVSAGDGRRLWRARIIMFSHIIPETHSLEDICGGIALSARLSDFFTVHDLKYFCFYYSLTIIHGLYLVKLDIKGVCVGWF